MGGQLQSQVPGCVSHHPPVLPPSPPPPSLLSAHGDVAPIENSDVASIATAMQRQVEQQRRALEQLRGMVERQRSEKSLLATKGPAHFAAAIQNSFRALTARRQLARACACAVVIEASGRRMLARRSARAAIHAAIVLKALARSSAARQARLRALRACGMVQANACRRAALLVAGSAEGACYLRRSTVVRTARSGERHVPWHAPPDDDCRARRATSEFEFNSDSDVS